jgi:hypothetical protein
VLDVPATDEVRLKIVSPVATALESVAAVVADTFPGGPVPLIHGALLSGTLLGCPEALPTDEPFCDGSTTLGCAEEMSEGTFDGRPVEKIELCKCWFC